MQRKLNWRLAIILMVVGALAISAVYGVHLLQVGRSKELFLTSAREAAEDGNIEHAVKSYELYLRLERKDAKVHAKLGQLYAEAGNIPLAYATFEQSLRLDPEDHETRKKQVAVAMQLARFLDAEDHLRRLLRLPKGTAPTIETRTKEDAELFDLLGQCQVADGVDTQLAAASYVTALQLDPEYFETYGRLATLLRYRLDTPLTVEQMRSVIGDDSDEAEENPASEEVQTPVEQAEQVINAMVARYPNAARAFYERSQYYYGLARFNRGSEQAEEWANVAVTDAEFALQRTPEDTEVILLAANCHLLLGNLDETRARAERGLELAPKTYQWYALLANVETRESNHEEAIKWYRRGIADVRVGRDELLNQLVDSLLNQSQLDEATEAIDDLRQFDTARRWVSYHEGRLYYLRENWVTSSRVLESVRPDFRSEPRVLSRIDSLLAGCYEQLGNDEARLVAIRRAATAAPDSIATRLGLVAALTANNRMEDAITEMRNIVSLDRKGVPVPAEVFFDLAAYEIRQNLRRSRVGVPNSVDWTRTEALVERASEKAPGSTRVIVLRAEILVGKKLREEAIEMLTQAIKPNPDELSLRIALANLHSGDQRWEEARLILDEAKEEVGDSVPLRLAMAQLAMRRTDGALDTDTLYELAETDDSFTKEEQAELLRELANYGLSMRETDFAGPLVERLVKLEPDKLDNWSIRFNLALRQIDSTNLDSALAKIEELEGKGPLWHYGAAVRLHLTAADDDIQMLEAALAHLDKSKMRGSRAARVALLKGHIQLRVGRQEAAIDSFTQAIELGERNPETVRQTVQLLLQRQRYQDADRVIKRFEERQTPYTAELGRLARQVSLQLNDFSRSIDLARRTADGSANYQDHLWFAQLATRAGREQPALLDEAEEAIRRAIELAESVPETWVAFVLLLQQAGREGEIDAAIADASQKIPPDQLPLALAQCYEGLQRFDEAEEQYQQAIVVNGDSPGINRAVAAYYLRMRVRDPAAGADATAGAEQHLKKLITSEASTPSDRSWARYRLASIELLRGGPQHLTNANNLLLENLAESPDSTPDLRLRGVVLAGIGTPTAREQAMGIWERVGMDNLTPYEGFVIAQLHESRGEWREAASMMQNTIARTTSASDQMRYISAYVAALIRNNELNEAASWVDTLRQRGNAAPEVVANFTAQIFARQGNSARAIRTLLDLVQFAEQQLVDSGTDGADQAARLNQLKRRVAAILESFARLDEDPTASALYNNEAEKLYKDEMARAAYLARRQSFDEALEVAEAAFDPARPDACLQVVVAVIESSSATAAHLEVADRILSLALAGNENARASQGLQMVQARLFTVQRRFEKAEEVYRELIAKHSQDYIARNNLAMVLAGQQKQLDEALRLVETAIQIAGPLPQLLDSQGLVVLAQGYPKLAVTFLKQAATDLKAADVYFHLAAAHYRSGQQNDAKAALEQANDIGLDLDKLNDFELELHGELVKSNAAVPTGLRR